MPGPRRRRVHPWSCWLGRVTRVPSWSGCSTMRRGRGGEAVTVEHEALRDSVPTPYWLDHPDRPAPRPALDAHVTADLCVVGGGYSGLWTAILAKERDPSRDVVLLEGNRIGWAASGRNGGVFAPPLTPRQAHRGGGLARQNHRFRRLRGGEPRPHRKGP